MTTKIFVPTNYFRQVNQAIKDAKVKFYPYIKRRSGYVIEFEPVNHPLCTFLLLKFDGVEILN